MAENPDDIKNLFETKETNSAGIYLITLYINGVKTSVIVDDYLPISASKLCFAGSHRNEMWVCLLEKAWAKLYGTYLRTKGGDPAFVGTHLMGTPGETLQHALQKDYQEFFRKLKSAHEKRYIMIAGSVGDGEDENAKGFESGNAYSLISLHEFTHKDKLV